MTPFPSAGEGCSGWGRSHPAYQGSIMLNYLLRRLIQAVPVILIIMVGTFLLLKLAPGDTVDALVGDMGGADPQVIARLRAEYGLDQPVWVQLWIYMAKLAQFDFGW